VIVAAGGAAFRRVGRSTKKAAVRRMAGQSHNMLSAKRIIPEEMRSAFSIGVSASSCELRSGTSKPVAHGW